MGSVLDLKKKKVEPESEPEPQEPIAQTAEAINQEITPTLASATLPYPISFDDEILTDSGERHPFSTVRWVGPLGYRAEGTGIPYVLAVVLGIVGILIGIYQRDLIAASLFIFMGVMLVVHSLTPHHDVPIEITPVSIKLGNRKYSHSEVHSFWIHYDLPHGVPELSLHLKRWHMPYLKIPLYETDPGQVRMVLLEFIPELEHEDSASHRLLKHLGI